MKKVTVIMPNYNHAPYLKQRMDSILAQDYPNFEVILLDDASTDNSAEVLSEYTKHPKVKKIIVNDTNSGNTFLQWQRGIKEATGDYIWIAESDDVAAPTLLSRLVEAIEQKDAVLAFCHSQWIDGKGQPIARTLDPLWKRDFSMAGGIFVRRHLMGYCSICNASAVVFRRDAVAAVDMYQVTQFTASGDRLFWIQVALQGRVAYVADSLNQFRQHTHKVSGGAEYKGLNIVQDHDIYRLISPMLQLTDSEKRIICGYHWKAMHRSTVSEDGRANALYAWAAEPEFGRLSYLFYLLSRAKDKC
ncbi:MAG: glycosyltransferase family 2 protein [Paludibacteraceae bacterium]|nr:glycosyltransferase family 2 protein [Paludibacteraceae bacterium]